MNKKKSIFWTGPKTGSNEDKTRLIFGIKKKCNGIVEYQFQNMTFIKYKDI